VDALSRKWPTHLLNNNVDGILLPNRLFASKLTLRNCIATVLLISIDTTIDPTPIADEPVLLVDTTNGQLSKQATPDAAGLDLFANEAASILAHSRTLIQLRIKIALPVGTYRQIAPQSGLLVKEIDIGTEVIDSDYQGELQVVVINHMDQTFNVSTSDRIAQLIVKKITFPKPIRVSNLNKTLQGMRGFGSTGIANIDLSLCDAISRHISEDAFGKNIHDALGNKSIPFPGRTIATDWTTNGKLLLFQERCYIPANQLLRRCIL
jgi:dUTP pyrophosphatase